MHAIHVPGVAVTGVAAIALFWCIFGWSALIELQGNRCTRYHSVGETLTWWFGLTIRCGGRWGRGVLQYTASYSIWSSVASIAHLDFLVSISRDVRSCH